MSIRDPKKAPPLSKSSSLKGFGKTSSSIIGLSRQSPYSGSIISLASSVRKSPKAAVARSYSRPQTSVMRNESRSINQSLYTLTRCVRLLSAPSGQKTVPYRDSKLTYLLRQSLGQTSLTVFVCCILDCPPSDTETIKQNLATLRFAKAAQLVKTRIKTTAVTRSPRPTVK